MGTPESIYTVKREISCPAPGLNNCTQRDMVRSILRSRGSPMKTIDISGLVEQRKHFTRAGVAAAGEAMLLALWPVVDLQHDPHDLLTWTTAVTALCAAVAFIRLRVVAVCYLGFALTMLTVALMGRVWVQIVPQRKEEAALVFYLILILYLVVRGLAVAARDGSATASSVARSLRIALAGPWPFRRAPRSPARRGPVDSWKLWGAAVAIGGGFFLPLFMRAVLELPQGPARLVQYAALFGAGYLIIRGRRRTAASAAELKSADRRPPIVLLRSFGDDMMHIRPKWLRWSFIDNWYRSGVTFERVVAKQLSLHGPVVAIGRPGEPLRPLGAARDYVAEGDWQSEVRRWIVESQFVFVIVGSSQGLAWEVQQLSDLRLMHGVGLLFPPLPPDQLNRRWDQLVDGHRSSQISILPEGLRPGRTLLLVFQAGDEPIALEATSRDEWSYETALRVGMAMMRGGSTGKIGVGPDEFRDSPAVPPLL